MIKTIPWLALLLVAGCDSSPQRPPPAPTSHAGLPVSGSMEDARRAGFTDCGPPDRGRLRCRRHGVMLEGTGPYEAAVDLLGKDGSGGFDELTLWHEQDQDALFGVLRALDKAGWQHCSTGTEEKGDQMIYTRAGVPVRISMDLSYWGKRRLRIIPDSNKRDQRC